MIAIDTNILVRVFLDDLSTGQIKAARQLVKDAKEVYLSSIVIIEMIWVALRAYKLTKDQALMILQEIHENAAFTVENEEQFTRALALYKKYNIDLSDCYILSAVHDANIPHLYTFDDKFSKVPGVKKLSAS